MGADGPKSTPGNTRQLLQALWYYLLLMGTDQTALSELATQREREWSTLRRRPTPGLWYRV